MKILFRNKDNDKRLSDEQAERIKLEAHLAMATAEPMRKAGHSPLTLNTHVEVDSPVWYAALIAAYELGRQDERDDIDALGPITVGLDNEG